MHVRHVKSIVERHSNNQGPEVIIKSSDVGKVVGSEVGKVVGNLESIQNKTTKKTVNTIVRLRSAG